MRSSSRRASTSAAPSAAMTLSTVSITMRRYGSLSSLRSSTTRPTTSAAPTLSATATVVSTSAR